MCAKESRQCTSLLGIGLTLHLEGTARRSLRPDKVIVWTSRPGRHPLPAIRMKNRGVNVRTSHNVENFFFVAFRGPFSAQTFPVFLFSPWLLVPSCKEKLLIFARSRRSTLSLPSGGKYLFWEFLLRCGSMVMGPQAYKVEPFFIEINFSTRSFNVSFSSC